MKNSTNIIVPFTKRLLLHIVFLIVFALAYGITGSKEGYALPTMKSCAGVTFVPVGSGYRVNVMYEMSKNKGTCIVYAQDRKTVLGHVKIENLTIEFQHKTGNITVTLPRGSETPTVTVSNTLLRDKRIHVHASCSYPKPNCAVSIEVSVGRAQITATSSYGLGTPKNTALLIVQPVGRKNNSTVFKGEITYNWDTHKITGVNIGVKGQVLLNDKTSIPYVVNVNGMGCGKRPGIGLGLSVKRQLSPSASAQAGVSSDGCRVTSSVELNWNVGQNTVLNFLYNHNTSNQGINATIKIDLP